MENAVQQSFSDLQTNSAKFEREQPSSAKFNNADNTVQSHLIHGGIVNTVCL